jgi:cytochrome c2
MTRRFFSLINVLFPLFFWGIFVPASFSQVDAATLFDDLCADCHSIGEGDMKGPDLLGVETRYSQDWLIKFTRSAKTLISAGDPKAIAVYEKYKKANMPDNDLSDAEIKALLAYIKNFNKSASKVESKPGVKSESKEAVSDSPEGVSPADIADQIQEEIGSSGIDENRISNIEKKLDILLAFQKKSLAARITDVEIKKGKDLFEGNTPFTYSAPACVSCHNTHKIDTLNWSPSAYDIATVFSERKNADLSDILINPVSGKMKEVLKNHPLTDVETYYVTAFLQDVEKTGLQSTWKFPFKQIAFVLTCLFFVLAIIDLFYTRLISYRAIHYSTLLLTGFFIAQTLVVAGTSVGLSKGYSPIQPIKFSHRIHVSDNQIDCVFCHNGPEYSRESGVPTTNVCMNCHNKIKSGEMTGQFEINKIVSSFKNNKSIEWVKIHDLPDHVFFSHAQHVSAGKVSCQKCHGEIEKMDVTRQYADLSMGWCVNCHRETEVQFEENLFYSKHDALRRDLKSGTLKKVTADQIGANNCQKCHY